MKNVKFEIGCTRTRQFTQAQITKVKEGITLLEKAINNPSFQERIQSYNWQSPNGTEYNRFHMSRGMSNTQIFECVQRGQNWFSPTIKATTPTVVNIVPCCTREEVVNNTTGMAFLSGNCVVPNTVVSGTTNTTTTVVNTWLNVSWLNNESCTPVHVASCIMHEYCVWLGFSSCVNGQLVNNYQNTIPYACGRIVKEIVLKTTPSNVPSLNQPTYEYQPCSTQFCFDTTPTTQVSNCARIDELMCTMQCELDWLENVSKRTNDETNRTATLTNTLATLKEMKMKLMTTSLDGCETVGTTTVMRTMEMVG